MCMPLESVIDQFLDTYIGMNSVFYGVIGESLDSNALDSTVLTAAIASPGRPSA